MHFFFTLHIQHHMFSFLFWLWMELKKCQSLFISLFGSSLSVGFNLHLSGFSLQNFIDCECEDCVNSIGRMWTRCLMSWTRILMASCPGKSSLEKRRQLKGLSNFLMKTTMGQSPKLWVKNRYIDKPKLKLPIQDTIQVSKVKSRFASKSLYLSCK